MKSYAFAIAFFVLLVTALDVRPAHAYLDPGTGSYAAQMLVAGLAVGIYTLRSFFKQMFVRITRLGKPRQ